MTSYVSTVLPRGQTDNCKVKESYRYRSLHAGRGLRDQALALFDACSGWIAVILIGALTACVAYVVDIAVVTVSDWKFGYVKTHTLIPTDLI